MSLRLSLTVCFVALPVLMGTMVQAATLDRIEGMVFVNHRGDGYVAVDNRTQVRPGDSVVANPGGRGQIVYDDGCTVIVEEGRVVLVREYSPCDPQSSLVQGMLEHHPLDWGAYALYAAGIAGAIGLGIAVFRNAGDDEPASP